jgi:hypothetical protein
MGSTLTNDYKAQFALALMVLKLDYTMRNAYNYSKTLIEMSVAAYLAEGKIRMEPCKRTDSKGKEYDTMKYVNAKTDNKIAECIDIANAMFYEAMEFMKISPDGRLQYVQHGVYSKCYEIDIIMLPLALSEGILDLKDVVGNAMQQISGWSKDPDA